MALSWEYVAGFLDAEGSIEWRSGSPRIRFYQTERNLDVLIRIQDFLLEKGIDDLALGSSTVNPKYDDVWYLRVATGDSRRLLERIGKWLIVKQDGELPKRAWPYIAGFFDGDGHLSDVMQRGYRTVRVVFSQKDTHVLNKINEYFSASEIPTIWGTNKAGCSNMVVSQKCSLIVLKSMLPHLIVKRDHAKEAADYLSGVAQLKEKHGYWYRKAMKGVE